MSAIHDSCGPPSIFVLPMVFSILFYWKYRPFSEISWFLFVVNIFTLFSSISFITRLTQNRPHRFMMCWTSEIIEKGTGFNVDLSDYKWLYYSDPVLIWGSVGLNELSVRDVHWWSVFSENCPYYSDPVWRVWHNVIKQCWTRRWWQKFFRINLITYRSKNDSTAKDASHGEHKNFKRFFFLLDKQTNAFLHHAELKWRIWHSVYQALYLIFCR